MGRPPRKLRFAFASKRSPGLTHAPFLRTYFWTHEAPRILGKSLSPKAVVQIEMATSSYTVEMQLNDRRLHAANVAQACRRLIDAIDVFRSTYEMVVGDPETGLHTKPSSRRNILRTGVRAVMLINGEPVLEPDFSQFHAQIIYALRGIRLIEDAYATAEYPRNFGKRAFNIAINASNRRQAVYAIASKLWIKKEVASQLLDAIIAKHKPIADLFCSDAGIGLMRIDSEITLRAVRNCFAWNVPTLPVHDSLIVRARDADRAIQIMKDAFEEQFPGHACVRVKS